MKIERKFYMNKLIDNCDNGQIKLITSIRSCDKSALLFDIFSNYLQEYGVKENKFITMSLDKLLNSRYFNPLDFNKVLHIVHIKSSEYKKGIFDFTVRHPYASIKKNNLISMRQSRKQP